jgi:toxin CcdB
MAQFSVHRNPDIRSNDRVPYLLDVQTNLLDGLRTRVVVPLIDATQMTPARRLNPVFIVEGRACVMATAELAAIRRDDLGDEVLSLETRRADIIAALDVLISGI